MVTTIGMMMTIFGISRVVNSIRAGIDIEPMIGPSTRPRKRSMIVQAAPPATWRKSSGQSRSAAIAATTGADRDGGEDETKARHDLELQGPGRAAGAGRGTGVRVVGRNGRTRLLGLGCGRHFAPTYRPGLALSRGGASK